MNKYSLYLIITLAVLLSSCGSKAIFEDQVDFEGGVWREDYPVTFEFQVTDASIPHQIDVHLRSSQEYSFHNLYFRYFLKDQEGKVLEESLENKLLFDARTGKPLGTGIGSIKETSFALLPSYTFPDTGTYQIEYRQYMRFEELEGIWSIGTSIFPMPDQE